VKSTNLTTSSINLILLHLLNLSTSTNLATNFIKPKRKIIFRKSNAIYHEDFYSQYIMNYYSPIQSSHGRKTRGRCGIRILVKFQIYNDKKAFGTILWFWFRYINHFRFQNLKSSSFHPIFFSIHKIKPKT